MEMIERKAPKFIEFTDGECVEGVLIALESFEKKDEKTGQKKKIVRFVMAEGDIHDDKFLPTGDRLCFLGTAQLIQDLSLADKGHYIQVRYEGKDNNVTKNGNAMKRFKVFVSRELVPGPGGAPCVDSTIIGDDDLPF